MNLSRDDSENVGEEYFLRDQQQQHHHIRRQQQQEVDDDNDDVEEEEEQQYDRNDVLLFNFSMSPEYSQQQQQTTTTTTTARAPAATTRTTPLFISPSSTTTAATTKQLNRMMIMIRNPTTSTTNSAPITPAASTNIMFQQQQQQEQIHSLFLESPSSPLLTPPILSIQQHENQHQYHQSSQYLHHQQQQLPILALPSLQRSISNTSLYGEEIVNSTYANNYPIVPETTTTTTIAAAPETTVDTIQQQSQSILLRSSPTTNTTPTTTTTSTTPALAIGATTTAGGTITSTTTTSNSFSFLPQPRRTNNNNNNNNQYLYEEEIEFGSVSTNTVTPNNNNNYNNQYYTTTNDNHNNIIHHHQLQVQSSSSTTTALSPITPTITPPTQLLQYPLLLSPPQFINDDVRSQHIETRSLQTENNNENNYTTGIMNDNVPDDMIMPELLVVSSTKTSNNNNNNNTTSIMRSDHSMNNDSNSLQHQPSSPPIVTRKTRPPRVPQQQITSAIHNSNINSNKNGSNSNNSSSSTTSHALPVSTVGGASVEVLPPQPPQQQQHYRVLSTGDASILSALTVDSDYNNSTTVGPNSVIATPNVHSHRSYVVPNRNKRNNKSGQLNHQTNSGGRGGTRSLSGLSTTSTKSGSPLHPLPRTKMSTNNNNTIDHLSTQDGNSAMMSGMNINIPSSIQQPILDDEILPGQVNISSTTTGKDNQDNISAPSIEIQSDSMLSRGPLNMVKDIDKKDVKDDLSNNISPLLHPDTSKNTPDGMLFDKFYDDNVESDDNIESMRRFHHSRLPKMSEYETEAETAILAAIDDDVKCGKMNSIRSVTFPNITNEESDQFSINEQENITNATTAFTRWYALQRAEMEMRDSIIMKREKGSNSSIHALDGLTYNASALFESVHRKNSYKAGVMGKKRSIMKTSDTLPINDSNNSNAADHQTHDDDAVDDAENGQRKNPITFMKIATQIPSKSKETSKRIFEERKRDWIAFEEIVIPQKESILMYVKNLMYFCILPSIALACFFFYVLENPTTGRVVHGTKTSVASVSWWIIFIGIRHPLVWSLAKATGFIFINYLGNKPSFMKLIGPRLGLIFAHSKGWPCELLLYGIFATQLLYGNSNFVKHWLYYSNHYLDIFSDANPAGNVTSREEYLRFLVVTIVIGFLVSLKRVWLGYYFGRRICARYTKDLHDLLTKLLLLSEIATLSLSPRLRSPKVLNVSIEVASLPSTDETNPTVKDDVKSSQSNLTNFLEEWDEPFQSGASENNISTLKDILEFRQTVDLMQTEYPFSVLFGQANNRENCAASAANVYERLVFNQSDSSKNLSFATLAIVATNNNGTVKQKVMKKLVEMFRPNKDKELTLLDFIRCVDTVYRELRTLSAGISNATAIERVFEMFLNVCFYIVLFFISMAILGQNVLSYALTLSTVILGLSFIIGAASSSMFEGMIMILVRRPYDIGDRIALSNVDDDTDPTGSLGWIVEDIDLFYTTVRFGASREVATLSNGSLARSRIINARRSDDASLLIRLKFGIDNSSSKQIQLFQRALEKFINDRPQEFHNTLAFRLNAVESDLGFSQYIVIVQCHSSWQKIRSVLDSRAKVLSFCLELQKKLNLRYIAPPMPIHLNMDNSSKSATPYLPGLGTSPIDPFRKSVATSATTRPNVVGGVRQKRDSDLVFSVFSGQDGLANDVNYVLSNLVTTADSTKKDQ